MRYNLFWGYLDFSAGSPSDLLEKVFSPTLKSIKFPTIESKFRLYKIHIGGKYIIAHSYLVYLFIFSLGFEFSLILAIYSFVLYIFECLAAIWSINQVIKEKLTKAISYDEKVFCVLLIILSCLEFTDQLFFWCDSSKLINFINNWKYFEVPT